MSEVANIPQLRFPEFGDNWEEKKLGNVTSIVMGQSPDSTSYNSNGIGLYLIQGNADIKKRKTLPRVWTDTPTKECKVGDIIMTVRAPVGAVAKSIHNACIGRGVCAIRNNQHSVSNYIYQFLLSFEKKWVKFEQGSTFTAVNTKDVKSLKLILPPVQEQQKIAAFLTAVDTKIEQLSKKQALFSEYKKGLMQQIFSQAIRFKADDTPGQPLLPNGNSPSGSEFPDWEEKKLGDIGHTFNGLTGKTKDDFGRGKPYIQYMQIFESSKINIDNFGLVDVRDDENQKVAQYGDVFFTTSSETPDAVGYSSVLLDDIDKLYLNSFCFGFRPNSLDELSPNFAQFLLRSANFRRRVVRLAQGSTRYNMSKVQLMKEVISLPCLKEQTKISNFLSYIDSKIEQVGKQLDESKQFKKALLQQMFV